MGRNWLVKLPRLELHPIAAWMPAIPDTIRRLIISFSCYYDIIVVGAPKNRYNGRTRDPAYYVCAAGKECNSRTLLRELLEGERYRSRNVVLSQFERYSRCSNHDSFQTLLFNSSLSLSRGKFTHSYQLWLEQSLLRIIDRKKSIYILILFYITGFKEEKIDDSNYFEGMEEILEENRVQNRALYLHRPFDSCE